MEEGFYNDHYQIILVIFVLVVLIWLIASTAVIVRQEVKVVESFGKYVRTLEPGLHFLVPILYTVREECP